MTPIAHLALAATMMAGIQGPDSITVGSRLLDPGRIPIGSDTAYSYRVSGSTREATSTTSQTVRRDTVATIPVIIVESRHRSPGGEITTGRITVRAADLALLHHEVRAEGDSMSASLAHGRATGWVVLTGGEPKLFDLVLGRDVLPVAGPRPWLVSALPLREGLHVTVARFSPWSAAESWHDYRVTGKEVIPSGGDAVECWVIDAGPLGPPGYRATLWLSTADHRVLRSALRGEPGQMEYWSFVGRADPGD